MAIGTLPDTDVNTRVPRRKNLRLFLEIWTTQVCHLMYTKWTIRLTEAAAMTESILYVNMLSSFSSFLPRDVRYLTLQ